MAVTSRKMNDILKLFIKILIFIHNLSYRYIGIFSQILEKGIHPKHRLMKYHLFFVNNINSGDSVLDIGCGNGYLTYDVSKKAKKVVAVDLDRKNIELAKKKCFRQNITYLVGDGTRLNLEEKFDVVVLSNILEHIEDRSGFLSRIYPFVDKFLIRVPMVNRDWLTYYKKELGCNYFLDPTHKIEYTLETFEKEMAEAGLKVKNFSVQFGEIWAVVTKNG